MASYDKEIKVVILKGERGYSAYQEAVANNLFSGTLEEWIETYATPDDYITRGEFQKVTQAQYDALKQAEQLVPNCYYLIVDDTSYQDIMTRLNTLSTSTSENTNDIDDLKNKTNNNTNDIDALNTQVEDNTNDIEALKEIHNKYAHIIELRGENDNGVDKFYITFTIISSNNAEVTTIPQLIDLLKTIPDFPQNYVYGSYTVPFFQASGWVQEKIQPAPYSRKHTTMAVCLTPQSDTELWVEVLAGEDLIFDNYKYTSYSVSEIGNYKVNY